MSFSETRQIYRLPGLRRSEKNLSIESKTRAREAVKGLLDDKYQKMDSHKDETSIRYPRMTATAGSDVVQSGRPIFDDFFQHLWPYIGNNTANVVFQRVKRLWLIRIDQ
ncbi:hypothetical protein TNCV_2003071 [Trichonephila clavipes]|nr:hypothetical protein TNCV_2003071 [Trichonephila clavipes]